VGSCDSELLAMQTVELSVHLTAQTRLSQAVIVAVLFFISLDVNRTQCPPAVRLSQLVPVAWTPLSCNAECSFEVDVVLDQ